MNKITNPSLSVENFKSTQELDSILRSVGCTACSLGFQKDINGCCVMRGNHASKLMIVGEAPGKDEDSTRQPFTGPAGKLLDKIWAAAGMDTRDWYLTNPVLCRPVAPALSGSQNLTPKTEQLTNCRPYLFKQIQLVKPYLIVALGNIALQSLLQIKNTKISTLRGKVRSGPVWCGGALIFPMYHPAAILHAARNPEQQRLLKEDTWEDVQKLKSILIERGWLP